MLVSIYNIHGVTLQTTWVFTTAAVITSNLV
jgi:hypothetical protein